MAKQKKFVPYPKLGIIPVSILPKIEYGSIVKLNPSEMIEWRVALNDVAAFDTLTNDLIEAVCDTLYLRKRPEHYNFLPIKCIHTEYLHALVDCVLDEESYLRSEGDGMNPNRYISGFMDVAYNPANGNIVVNFVDDYSGRIRLTVSTEIQQALLICDAYGLPIKRYIEFSKAVELYAVVTHKIIINTDGIAYSESRVRPMNIAIGSRDFSCIEKQLHYDDSPYVNGCNLVGENVFTSNSTYTITFFGHEICFSGDTLEYRLAKYLFIKASSNHSVLIPNFYESEYRKECWDCAPKEKQTVFKNKVYQAARQLNTRLSQQLNLGSQKSVTTTSGKVSLNKVLLGLSDK